MTTKPPAFQWYAKDWLTDDKRTEMSLAQRGAYADLLSYQWVNGAVPGGIDGIARVLGVGVDEATEIWSGRLPECFEAGEDGRLRNPVLESYRVALQEYHDQQVKSGQKGARSRWHGNPNGTPIGDPISESIATPMADECEPQWQPQWQNDGSSTATAPSTSTATSEKRTGTKVPDVPPTIYDVFGEAIKQHLYPKGCTDKELRTELSIVKAWRKTIPDEDILGIIRGLAILRDGGELHWLAAPGENATLKGVHTRKDGDHDVPLRTLALHAYDTTRPDLPREVPA